MEKPLRPRANTIRKIAQLIFLFVFLFLFIRTDYTGSDEIPYAVNILFRIDPLVAAASMLAAKTIIFLVLPSLILVGLTLIFGRFFCGWVCPLGTLIDGTRSVARPRHTAPRQLRSMKHIILTVILVTALFGLPLVGYFDPFAILVRGLTIAVYPAMNVAVRQPFDMLYQWAPDLAEMTSEPVYDILKKTILPFSQKVYTGVFISLAVFLAVFAAEFYERRFFCRNVCPLGALLGNLARFAPFKGKGGTNCKNCSVCRTICRMDAFDSQGRISPEACNLCMDCVRLCPGKKIRFGFGQLKERPQIDGISRRAFIGSLAAGALAPVFFTFRPLVKNPPSRLLRPPGALPEKEFLARCVRCGECMKVCIGNALHPALTEAGLEGMFTPRLIPRIGYCEYNCTLCGQVCPTGAIKVLSQEEKHQFVIGKAWFDKNRCLPYADGTPCIVCEEHCPTPDKAIKFRWADVTDDQGKTVTVKQPYIIDSLCIGCGICETKCPLPGRSAVLVTRDGETRRPESGNTPYSNSGYGYS